MNINDLYQFNLDVPGLGVKRVYPVNNVVNWKWEKDEEFGYYRMVLDTPLIFIDDDTNILDLRYDFSWIYQKERERDYCAEFRLDVLRRCDADPFVLIWQGVFTVQQCDFNVDQCRVEVQPIALNDLKCLTDNWEEQVNWLEIDSDFDPSSGFLGVVEETTPPCALDFIGNEGQFLGPGQPNGQAGGGPGDPCGDPLLGWVMLKNTGNYQPNPATGPIGGTWNIRTTYVREYVASSIGAPSTDPAWIDLGGNEWARPVPLSQVTPYTAQPSSFIEEWEVTQLPDPGEYLQNGRYLNSLILDLVDKACMTLDFKSNFLSINPDATNPSNTYYDYAAAHLQELAYFPVHDIVSGPVSNPSFRIDEWTLKDLFSALNDMFNLYLFWDGNTLYLEHLSYVFGLNRVDLTIPVLEKYILGKWQYTYNEVDNPRREEFLWADKSDNDQAHPVANPDFDGSPIYYAKECTSADNIITRLIPMFLTNIEYILRLGEGENNKYFGTNFFLIASTEGGAIKVGSSCLPPFSQNFLNIYMGWPCLHENLWKYGRPNPVGRLNTNETVFHSVRKFRSQAPIMIPLCCEEFQQFKPEDRWKTQMGWGEVEEAMYSDPAGKLTLSLLQ